MTRERPGRRTGHARSRPALAPASAAVLALAAISSGCMVLPSPSGIAGWPTTEPGSSASAPTPAYTPVRAATAAPAIGSRTRITSAVRPGSLSSDPSISRVSMAQPAPSTPPSVPALPGTAGSSGVRPIGAAPGEATTAPAVDIRTPSVPPTEEYPIDLATALRLAERDNPVIGAVRARIGEALANQLRARTEMLPDLNAGVDYDGHTGNLQQSSGKILNLSRQSVYFGGGAYAVGPGSPLIPAVFINEPIANALFDPLAAHQQVDAAEANAVATTNAVLLEVTQYYLDLLGAGARLEADRRGVVEAEELMKIAERYAQTGEGRPSDFHRIEAEWRIRRAEVRHDEEEVAVASARLCRRLHLDPSVRIRPISEALEVLALVDLETPTEELIQVGIERRPEVRSSSAEVSASDIRLKQEVARPFLPTLFLGFSGAGFGGGSNLNTPLVGNFAGRTDFDVAAYWTLLNGGLGNLLLQKQNRARVGEAVAQRARTIALVRQEVASALGDARARLEQVEVARERYEVAAQGFRRDIERALEADPNKPGNTPRPIETINSLKLLIVARRMLVRTVIDYDQAQFRLFVAMGSPPPLEHPVDPGHAPVTIQALASPVTGTPPALRPPGMQGEGPGAGTHPNDGRGLVEAETDLTRTLERMAREGAGAAAGGPFAALAEAHRQSMTALLEYDRLQAELFRSVTPGTGASNPSDQVDRLLKLAEAHRKLMRSKVDYDETLWGLVRTLGAGTAGSSSQAIEASKASIASGSTGLAK